MIRVPGVTTAGSRSAALSELVDLFPTLTELCQVQAPTGMQGISLVPCLRDPNAPGKTATYTVVTRGKQPVIGRSTQFEHWRYAEWGSAQECELYDHRNDPGEHHNLAQDAQHAAVLTKAREVLRQRQQAANASRPGATGP
jgi:uncharacterized sulfatase